MKAILYGVLALVLIVLLVGMGSCVKNRAMVGCSHVRSQVYGLNRSITWTGMNGEVKRWDGNFRIEYEYSAVRLVDLKTSKTIVLGGNFCIEEK